MVTPSNIEKTIEKSICMAGYPDQKEIPVPQGWRDPGDPNAILTGSTTPVLDLIASLYTCMVWVAADDATVLAEHGWTVEDWYAENENALQLVVDARKFDAGTVNSDLALTVDVAWQNPGEDTAESLTTNPSETLADPVTSGNGGWAKYTLDIGERLRLESKQIKAGAKVVLSLGVSETVGTSNRVEVRGTTLKFRRHASLIDQSERAF